MKNKQKQKNTFWDLTLYEREGNTNMDKSLFYFPTNDKFVSGSEYSCSHLKENHIEVEMKSLSTIVNMSKIKSTDFIKMDIEGSEFKCIKDIKKLGFRPKQLCVEVHDRFFSDGMQKLIEFNDYLCAERYHLAYISDDGLVLTYVFGHNQWRKEERWKE